MKEYKYKILEGEFWWFGVADEGVNMPLCEDSEYTYSILPDYSGNQTTTALLSSKGRYIYCEDGFLLNVSGGEITLKTDSPVHFEEGLGTLKNAYLNLSKRFFPFDGKGVPNEFFANPQFNTWIEYTYYITQEKVLDYARSIRKNSFDCDILFIDCGWDCYYGSFSFNAGFPNPKGMVDELHAMGFKVVLWACPFISADSKEFRYLRREDMLVKNADGSVAIREWWDGFSAVVDLTNPKTEKWFTGKLDALMENFGFDGFKLDAGDQFYYRDDDVTYGGGSAIDSSKAWSKLGARYAYTEFRSSINMGGKSMVQRLKDKQHSYEGNGLAAIVPATLMQHLFGYYFTCPDMIGGGEFSAFGEGKLFDEQLMVRFCQCSAMLPMMQFSIAPWRILSKENYVKVRAAAETRKVLAEAYKCLFYGLNSSAEPIVRLLEYNYPGCGYERITDEFMIGEEFLCAPIVEPSITEKTVILPQGKWLYNGEEIDGGEYTFKVTADTMPIFKKLV